MNRRLQMILNMIPDGLGTVDVGTDHGYLPVALAQRGYPGHIFASDLRKGPLDAARRSAERACCAEKIQFLLCDGLELCPHDKIDTIVIAGMGGDTICGILDRAEFCYDARYRLILQPMTHPEVLRYWLIYNGFGIEEEHIVEDRGNLYPVFSAVFGRETRLCDAELYIGGAEHLYADPLYPQMIRRFAASFEKKLAGVRSAMEGNRGADAAFLESILNELKEMEDNASGS